jgi:hypothetical protein
MEMILDDPIHNMKVKGSHKNEWFYDYLKYAVDLQKVQPARRRQCKNKVD